MVETIRETKHYWGMTIRYISRFSLAEYVIHCSLFVQPFCAAFLCSLFVQPFPAAFLYSLFVQPFPAAFLCSLFMQPFLVGSKLRNQWNPTPGCGLGQALGNSEAIHNGGCYVNMVEWMQTYMPMMGVFCLVFMVFEMAVIVIVFVMRNQAEELSHPVRLN
eukprot:sb/3472837/